MGQLKDNRQIQTIHYSGYINFMNVDLLVTFVMWLLVATIKSHFKTCFCAVCQDLRPPFYKIFFSARLVLYDYYPVWFTIRKVTVLKQWSLTAAHVRDQSAAIHKCTSKTLEHFCDLN